MFYEVIYEDGSVSVLSGNSDEEALSGVENHHLRAVSGEAGGPAGGSATRVKRVLVYDVHPGDFRADGLLSADEVNEELKGLVKAMTDKNGLVNVLALAENLKTIVHPMIDAELPHDSRFKMQEERELTLTFI